MLYELIIALQDAETLKEKEQAYKRLAKVGVDRTTANFLAKKTKRRQLGRENDTVKNIEE